MPWLCRRLCWAVVRTFEVGMNEVHGWRLCIKGQGVSFVSSWNGKIP